LKTAGLLMAAGKSRRFGADNKLLAMLGGKCLVQHAAGTLRSMPLSHLIAVVADARVGSILEGFEIIAVSDPENGFAANIAAGIKAVENLGADRVLIALGDMPFVSADHFAAVIAACTPQTPSASFDGQSRMPPACFHRNFFSHLQSMEGDRGAAKILKDLPNSALVCDPNGMLADIDFIQDLTTKG
jgi:molybdenum cofactor cytidylyltransferase